MNRTLLHLSLLWIAALALATGKEPMPSMSVYCEAQEGAPGAVEFSYQDVRTGKKVIGFYTGASVIDIQHMSTLGRQPFSAAADQQGAAFVCSLNAKGMQSLRDYLGQKEPTRLVVIINGRFSTILTADFIRDLVEHHRELEVPFPESEKEPVKLEPAKQ